MSSDADFGVLSFLFFNPNFQQYIIFVISFVTAKLVYLCVNPVGITLCPVSHQLHPAAEVWATDHYFWTIHCSLSDLGTRAKSFDVGLMFDLQEQQSH